MSVFTLIGSLCLILIWPFGDGRLVVPLLPAGIAFLAVGAFTLGSRLSPRTATMTCGSLAALLCWSALIEHRQRLGPDNGSSILRRNAYGPGNADRRLVAAAQFASHALPTDVVIATTKPPTVYHFSRRRTVDFGSIVRRLSPDSAGPLARLGFTHIVLAEVRKQDWAEIAPRLFRYCASLEVVAEFPPATVLLSLGVAETSDGAACRYFASRLRKDN